MTEITDPSGVPMEVPRKTVPKNIEQDWVERDVNPYDANRYDPEQGNDKCLVCGTPFEGSYYPRSGGSESCPECEVTVKMLD